MQLPFFVYGTLRAGQTNAHLMRGAIERSRLAKLSGAQMFDLGSYPMLIEGEYEVWGELVEIEADKYEAILKSLDRLESVNGNNREITVEGGQIEAWIYFGREVVARRGCIVASGDWVRRFKNSARNE